MTDTGEIVFQPKYGFRQRFGLVAAPIMAALSVFLAIVSGKQDPEIYLAAGFFLLCAVAILFHAVRRIRFGDEIYVDRYLLPSRRFRYSDVKDIGVSSISFKKGRISLRLVENVAELHDIFERVMKEGRMSEGQIEGELLVKEIRASVAMMYALLSTFVISLVLHFVRTPWPWLSGRLGSLAVIVVVYPVCYLIVKLRTS